MARLTDTLQQQTKEIVSETAQKRKKREVKEKVKNIAYFTLYDKFYKQQEEPLLIYLKLNNMEERQKFIDDLPAIYKVQNDYINEQEASEIYTKELNRLFKIFQNNKKYIDQQDNEFLQEQEETEEIEQEETEEIKNNNILSDYKINNFLNALEFLGIATIKIFEIGIYLIFGFFYFIFEMLKPIR